MMKRVAKRIRSKKGLRVEVYFFLMNEFSVIVIIIIAPPTTFPIPS